MGSVRVVSWVGRQIRKIVMVALQAGVSRLGFLCLLHEQEHYLRYAMAASMLSSID